MIGSPTKYVYEFSERRPRAQKSIDGFQKRGLLMGRNALDLLQPAQHAQAGLSLRWRTRPF